MKTFRYKRGHVAMTTMTAVELIEKLKQYPPDTPVIGTWEGVTEPIEEKRFKLKEFDCGETEDRCECLIIDVDQY